MTRPLSLTVLLSAVLLALLAAPAVADVRVALVVANSAYRGAPLGNPKIDAGIVAASLTNMGFKVTVVEDADLAVFDEALQTFGRQAKGADAALFYFSGHGFALSDGLQARSYLMSTSAAVTSASDRVIRSGGIAHEEIVRQLAGQAKATLVFVDACRSDPHLKRGGTSGRGFVRPDLKGSDNIFVGLSTRLGDTAEDGEPGRGSPFARAFALEMARPGIRIDDAFTEVRKAVSTETNGAQRPEVTQNDLDSALVLVSVAPPAMSEPERNSATAPGPSRPQVKPATAPPTQIAISNVKPDTSRPPSPTSAVSRAAMLVAVVSDPQKPAISMGTVVWSLIPADARPGAAAGMRAEVEIPDAKMRAVMTIQKNAVASLPASHTIDLLVTFASGAEIKGIEDIALPQLRSD